MLDVELEHTVKGRHTTIATHLQHFLSFIRKDTKLKGSLAEGIAMVRLETGVLQKAAIGLYESLGYCHIQPFGSYLDDPLSLFMEKHLVASVPA